MEREILVLNFPARTYTHDSPGSSADQGFRVLKNYFRLVKNNDWL